MRTAQTGTLWRIVSTRMPTKRGMFDAIGFERDVSNGTRRIEIALAIVMGDLTEGLPLLRIHSQCDAGIAAHSLAYLQTKKQKMGHTLTLHMECPA